ncbi:MAG: MFS transporter [Bacteriovoracaceae bacterium]
MQSTSVSSSSGNQSSSLLSAAVIVAALGYFVDIFDLLLFSIVRKTSLLSIGVAEVDQVSKGLLLHNLQMIGMLLGGVFWGILADKKGRLSVLFGSIFLYSVANIANGFVHSVTQYAICRIISGIGLAGELGAGITLVAESLPKEKRGYGTMIVATIGVSGAVVAGLVGEFFDWRVTYIIGGALGIGLLLLRINTVESSLFQHAEETDSKTRGQFLTIFQKKERFLRFLYSILIAVPIWYVVGTLIQLSPEIAKELGVMGDIKAGRAVMFCYGGLTLGDLGSGLVSQLFKSRKKAILAFIIGLCGSVFLYFTLGRNATPEMFYGICLLLGFFSGYWAVFVTTAAEQFGTNLRGTVATCAPNFVRASVVPMSLTFTLLKMNLSLANSAIIIGIVVLAMSIFACIKLQETFYTDLNFYEKD